MQLLQRSGLFLSFCLLLPGVPLSASAGGYYPTNGGTQAGQEGSEGGSWSSFASTLVTGAGDAVVLKEFISLINKPERTRAYYISVGLAGIYLASRIQKANPEFFAALWRLTKSPLVFLQKKSERFFCGGESLSWNVMVSWHNRIFDALTPLTKQSSVMDLTKEKRIKALNQEHDQLRDPVWQQVQDHIYEEFAFISKQCAGHLRYYQDQEEKEKKRLVAMVAGPVQTAAKACVRLSIKRHEEISFYVRKMMTYCNQLCDYIMSVSSKEALDKELIKRSMEDLCSTCKHIAILVDETTASSSHGAAGQLSLVRTQAGAATSSYAYNAYGTGSDYTTASY